MTKSRQRISNIEIDIHDRQEIVYKLMKHLNQQQRESARLYEIRKDMWISHYKELWIE